MKKIALTIAAMMVSLASFAQFEADKFYIGASLSSFDLSYNGLTKGNIGMQAKGGYFVSDNLMALAQLSYQKQEDVPYSLSVGLGGRYYIVQNGLYLGASAVYKHCDSYDDFMPSVQLGYAFYISRTVTIEPEIYYEQSFKDHKDYSQVGLRVGIGVYLFRDAKQN
jgi:hypothetical protein